MAVVTLEVLKGYFNAGDVPSESNYVDLIDTLSGADDCVLIAPATSARNTIQPTADVVPLTLKGHVSQTANLMEWVDNADIFQAGISPEGHIGLSETPTDPNKVINIEVSKAFTGTHYGQYTRQTNLGNQPGYSISTVYYAKAVSGTTVVAVGMNCSAYNNAQNHVSLLTAVRATVGGSETGVACGDVLQMRAYWARIYGLNSSTTITDTYGFQLAFVTTASTFVNVYGIYLNDVTVGTTLNYAIYTNAGQVSFGDDVEFRQAAEITTTVGDLTLSPAGIVQIYKVSGDPLLIFDINGVDSYAVGIDDTDNKFKINSGTTLSGVSDFEIDPSGNVQISGHFSTAIGLSVGNIVAAPNAGSIYLNIASGDPMIQIAIADSVKWAIGVDDSDLDKLKINVGGSLANPSYFEIDVSGNVEIAAGGRIGSGLMVGLASTAAAAGTVQIRKASGDPMLIFDINGTDEWTVGVDDSDLDKFKINSGGSLANPSLFEIDTLGNVELAGDIYIHGTPYLYRNSANQPVKLVNLVGDTVGSGVPVIGTSVTTLVTQSLTFNGPGTLYIWGIMTYVMSGTYGAVDVRAIAYYNGVIGASHYQRVQNVGGMVQVTTLDTVAVASAGTRNISLRASKNNTSCTLTAQGSYCRIGYVFFMD